MPESVFSQISAVLALAVIIGTLAQWLRQPLIVAFIAVGILVGPSAMGLVVESSEIELFAKLGIALLLFVVGLKLDLHIIKTVGPVALASGLGQVAVTSLLGYALARMLGLEPVTALYVAVALTFSSTIIIVKLLSDKREVDALHGRIAIGFLIVQDIVVVLVMIGLTAFGHSNDSSKLLGEAINVLLSGLAMLAVVALLMRYVLTPLLHRLAHSSELLVLFAIAWAVVGAVVGDQLGFSKEVGAFLAGVSIASTPYREPIAARLVSLRDFLLLFFFIELGSTLDLSTLGSQFGLALVFSAFVLFGNPLIVMSIMGFMGYRRRTGFLAGLTVAQISEFSLILAALGLSLGHLSEDSVGLITLVGLITISVSTYMILYSHVIYERLSPYLQVFERQIPFREVDEDAEQTTNTDVVVIGLGRYGASLAASLREAGCRFSAIDFDPGTVQRHIDDGYSVHYGDAEDPEFITSLPLTHAQWVVSTVRDPAVNRVLIHGLEKNGYQGKIAIATDSTQQAKAFQALGVERTLMPYADAARQAASQLTEELQRNVKETR
jgi:Kef-type K+ transport system membrane component KefB